MDKKRTKKAQKKRKNKDYHILENLINWKLSNTLHPPPLPVRCHNQF
jgi:hypothetical protein